MCVCVCVSDSPPLSFPRFRAQSHSDGENLVSAGESTPTRLYISLSLPVNAGPTASEFLRRRNLTSRRRRRATSGRS